MSDVTDTLRSKMIKDASERVKVPSVEGDLGGPVVERAGHKDLLGDPRPPEHRRPGLRGRTLAFTLQVLLPGQKFLYFLWSLVDSHDVSVNESQHPPTDRAAERGLQRVLLIRAAEDRRASGTFSSFCLR